MSQPHAKSAKDAKGQAPAPTPAMLSDSQFEEIESVIHSTIEELVVALIYLRDDEYEDAQECLTTSGANVDRVQEVISTVHRI
jgi:hypothetical protein